jgi:hypothetical protein
VAIIIARRMGLMKYQIVGCSNARDLADISSTESFEPLHGKADLGLDLLCHAVFCVLYAALLLREDAHEECTAQQYSTVGVGWSAFSFRTMIMVTA